MVLDYYKLREEPFGVTPDPRYLYPSATHREALASLLYGIEAGRGFVALIAKPGMGKTTLLFHTLQQLRDKASVVFLFQTICTPVAFLRALLADLGVHEIRGSLVKLQSRLNDVLAEHYSRSGKPLVIVIDEAQNLNESVLELVRMLSNFETSREKLLQIVLSGQPQLAEKLASPELVQLRQRISIIARLQPLSLEETALYIDHRMRRAGYSGDASLFTASALDLIARSSAGIPRNVNNLCFNALSLGCALKRGKIDCEIVREVLSDLEVEPLLEEKPLGAPLEEKGDKQKIPASLPPAGRRSMPPGRFLKFALPCAVLLALAGMLYGSPHFRGEVAAMAAAPETLVHTDGVMPPLVPVETSSAAVEQRSQPSTIRVAPGQTIYRICAESFGSCTTKILQEIRRLNPWLSNLDHIESGQRIRIRAARSPAGAAQTALEQAGNTSAAEGGTQ